MQLSRWWERWPDRLQYELQALETAGLSHEIDQAAFHGGVVRLHVTAVVGGEEIPLVVLYPDLFPYFRIEIEAPTLNLPHHQNPAGKNLCVLGRPTDRWHTNTTAAELIQNQFPKVLSTGRSNDPTGVVGIEQQQAEPVSAYFPYPPSIVLLDTAWNIDSAVDGGTFALGTAGAQGPPPRVFLRGAVFKIESTDGRTLAEAHPAIRSTYSGNTIVGSWVRAPRPILEFVPTQFVKYLLETYPTARDAAINRVEGGMAPIVGSPLSGRTCLACRIRRVAICVSV
jgi:hypothetical protein